jgi:uncharacterized membrane protein
MSEKTEKGIALSVLAFVVLLALKLTGNSVVETWSWWWITAPIWVPVAVTVAGAYLWFIAGIIINVFRGR